ncbi:MAG: hypothetical protein HOF27_14620 [Rhodospirillaceae bacterium]|mgnify:FL=1|jgi:hypothetical protein|nr:hypothetical protein [Rhodospirillaceae bacterium]MBT5110009.1 hypothetical protein [Rhodospirillaceae bacterium]MBT5664025.1 hypothetical protein [Rhodospirillaceae bacterium]
MLLFDRPVDYANLRVKFLGAATSMALMMTAGASYAESKGPFSIFPLGQRTGVVKLKEEYVPFKPEKNLPERPALMLEFPSVEKGGAFLGVGNLGKGFKVPLIGAVWQPRLWGYMISRTAFQSFKGASPTSVRETEIANRTDLYANLQLTGTEKILLGLRPFDNNEPGRFTKYVFEGTDEDFKNELNLDVESLFFEGDLGSLFPVFDKAGIKPIDFGFTVGRQNVFYQKGMLISDTVDMVGLVRNNMYMEGAPNLRIAGMYSWNRLDNGGGTDTDPEMFGLFTAVDFANNTVNVDAIYVNDDGSANADGFYLGLSSIQRIKGISTAFRINSSVGKPEGTTGDGSLISAEISHIVPGSDDIWYVNPYVALGNFTQAGREAINGGPLGNLGILFASPNLSRYGAEISPFVNDVAGFAMGYQAFWDDHHRNMILEFANKIDYDGRGFDSYGLGFQVQQKVGQYVQLTFEGYAVKNTDDQDDNVGGRFEVQVVY